jgi:type VI secretion system secreted protein Hcp
MATNTYMTLTDRNGALVVGEGSVAHLTDVYDKPVPPASALALPDYSFDVAQLTGTGSAPGTGAGAGKITLDPLSITRPVDVVSPQLFTACAVGTPFQQLNLMLVRSGTGSALAAFLQFTFKVVMVQTISWSHDDESPREAVTFAYGGLQIRYRQQTSSGSLGKPVVAGWDGVRNIPDTAP